MPKVRISGLFAVTCFLLVAGCTTQTQRFSHKFHRVNYALDEDEIKTLQFYISTDVLAKTEAEDGPGEIALLVRQMTPGVVLDVGANWLQVSFTKDRPGAVFLAQPDRGTSDRYYLATTLEGKDGFHQLRNLEEKVLVHEGEKLSLVYGSNAHLLVNDSQLQKLIEKRLFTAGRRVEDEE